MRFAQILFAGVCICSWLPPSEQTIASSVQSLVQPTVNTSSLGTPSIPVDPGFDVNPIYHSLNNLALNDCLMVAVNEMANLALLAWNSRSHRYRSASLPKYNRVYIEIEPEPPALEIETRFLVWGFTIAMINIIHHRQFIESDFELIFERRTVGWIRFRSQRRISKEQPELSKNTGPFNPLEVTTKVERADDFVADFRVQAAAKPINALSAFITIFCTLQTLALPPSTGYSSQNFRVSPAHVGISATFTSQDGPGLPRRSPPFLQYRWIIETMRQLPGWMFDNRFAEVGVVITVNGVFVGAGFLDTN